MQLNESKISKRKRLALFITILVGLVLLSLLILRYSSPTVYSRPDSESKIKNFYSTILKKSQSAILNK